MKKSNYKIRFKLPKRIHKEMLEDLKRPHRFSHERVGFLFTTSKQLANNTIIVLAKEYIPVDDADYILDENVGAKINSFAIRKAMQRILENKEGCFHVHLHNHKGVPSPSSIDKKGLPGIPKSFANVSQNQANGILILSKDAFYITIKFGNEDRFISPELISVVGYPLNLHYPSKKQNSIKKTQNRQSFLGGTSQIIFDNIKVGIVGYGGGGSHIGQQLAHLGVENIFVFDDDKVEETNLNRMIGAWFSDVKKSVAKVSVAKRLIIKILPSAKVSCINDKWQQKSEILQNCDVVFGCVDSYTERQQLEAECRRYLIPYIDIGMDVHKVPDESYAMSGQVILSMPGSPCMHCFGFLTEKKLGIEAARYGDLGGRPQVVWANGTLASTGLGFVDLVTGWSNTQDKLIYILYDGNTGYLGEHIRLKFSDNDCTHYTFDKIGIPFFKKL